MTLRTDISSPLCTVEIYPANSYNNADTKFVLSGADLLAVSVQKDIREGDGNFTITLAPGGPASVNQSWADIITPMSLVLIGMGRAGRASIVMIGVVTQINEATNWASESVQRGVTITGMDFAYYFTMYSYYALGFLGSLPGTVAAEGLGVAVAAPELLNGGFTNGTPAEIGLNFIAQAMFGKNFGLMQNVKVRYQNGQILTLYDIFSTAFQDFPGAYVRSAYDYVTTEQSWYAKFQNIFPFPWYEFFVTTCEPGFYGLQDTGTTFTMSSIKAPAVSVCAVARINPTPVLNATANLTSGKGATVDSADQTLWNALPLFSPDELRPRQTNLQFGVGDTCNYFAINPTFTGSMFGSSNTGVATWLFAQESAVDTSSMVDFGFRPAILPVAWYGDPNGSIAQNENLLEQFPQTSTNLVARIASTYGPIHLMATCSVILPLRPDIRPGATFKFKPYKQDESWTFYIQSVQHNFQFGGQSTTVLILTNGLPTEIYSGSQVQGPLMGGASNGQNGTNTGDLFDLLRGKFSRAQGMYNYDPTRSGATFFGPNSNLNAIFGNVSKGFNSPGGTAPNT